MPRDGEQVVGPGLFEAIGIAYAKWRKSDSALPPWEVLLADNNHDVQQAATQAVAVAKQSGAGPEFELEVAVAARPYLSDGGAQARTGLLSGLSQNNAMSGEMQALLAGGSLADFWSLLPALMMTGTACARISVQGQPFGTGFLIDSDLVITAGHVVASLVGTDGRELPGSAGSITMQFPPPPNAAPGWPTEPFKAAANNWLEFWSYPTGTPPVLEAGDPRRLDCALIRLERALPVAVPRVDMRTPPEPDTSQVHVIGFFAAAGNLVFDGGRVCLPELAADGRVRHSAAAVRGMSGSPYLDWKGRPCAIHEGTSNTPQPHNRGVALHAIRRAMCDGRPDPLAPRLPDYMWALDRFDVQQEWSKAGVTWTGPMNRHPVFGRRELQLWIADALAPGNVAQPFAFVFGGTGKTFSVDLLRARLNPTTDPVAHIPPELVQNGGAAEILRRIIVAAGRAPATLPDPEPSRRPEEGVLRLDLLQPALSELASLYQTGQFRHLWLAADIGRPGAWNTSSVNGFWSDFLKLAPSCAEWLRVLLIGLHPNVASSLAANVGRDLVSLQRIGDLDWDDVWTTMRQFRPVLDTEKDARMNDWIARVPDPADGLACIQTVRYVMDMP